jgi:hypothetical protein
MHRHRHRINSQFPSQVVLAQPTTHTDVRTSPVVVVAHRYRIKLKNSTVCMYVCMYVSSIYLHARRKLQTPNHPSLDAVIACVRASQMCVCPNAQASSCAFSKHVLLVPSSNICLLPLGSRTVSLARNAANVGDDPFLYHHHCVQHPNK